ARVEQSAYGERGRVYRVDPPQSPRGAVALGRWGDELVVFGSEAFVRDSLDRVEGRAAPEQQLPEDLTYGEAYGVIPGAALQPLLRGAPNGIGERLAALASRVELHADAMSDVAIVARVTGADAAGLDDLARSIGAAMAIGRMQAKARGTDQLADVLEYARVERGHSGAGFSVELAIPTDVLERWFAGCGEERAGGATSGGVAPAEPR
ncbi:MAG TPA: hypothetical protein VFK85_16305, partial [Anaeromyxobacteraceae bacterium]|nr:hypothetical protein [Anaeromyxobacteraceae bacterium]